MSPNAKDLGGPLGVQCTRQARSADLAEIERPDSEHESVTVQGDPVRIVSVNGIILAASRDRVPPTQLLDLVETVLADRDAESMSEIRHVKPFQSGEGVAISLPESIAEGADLEEGTSLAVTPLPDILTVTRQDEATARLVSDLRTIREEQM